MRYAGRTSNSKSARAARPGRLPRAATGMAMLGIALVLALLGIIPPMLGGAYFVASGLSYILYARDKGAAERKAWRTPEGRLHLADLLGGWPGGLVAQQRYRHKTAKRGFQLVFWVSAAANLVGAWWLVASGAMDDQAPWH